jgi:hypothetical protein
MKAEELRGQVRGALSPDIVTFMDGIERFAGRNIEFAFNNQPPPDNYPNATAACILEDGARILLREGGLIEPQNILHELLHIHRYWVQHTPQLEPLVDHESNWEITRRIEDALEHLVIVPREANFGFAPRLQWHETAMLEWSAYPWPDNTEPQSRSLSTHLGWLACELVAEPKIRDLAKD